MTRITDKVRIERKGITFINQVADSMASIFRETPHTDIGIDGYLEIFEQGIPIALVGIQSKAGTSYFRNETEDSFSFVTDKDHIQYWMAQRIPVVVVVSRPDQNEGYWINVNEFIEANPQLWALKRPSIRVDKGNRFDKAFKDTIRISSEGYYSLTDYERLYSNLSDIKHSIGSFLYDGVTLFVLGLIDDEKFIFHVALYADETERQVGFRDISALGRDFLDRYIQAVADYRLIPVPKEAIGHVMYERELHPVIFASLTNRGRGFTKYVLCYHPKKFKILKEQMLSKQCLLADILHYIQDMLFDAKDNPEILKELRITNEYILY